MPRAPCVSVEPESAEKARRILRSAGYLARGLKAARSGGRVLFPVTDPEAAIQLLSSEGVRAEPCYWDFEQAPRGPASPREYGLPGYWLVGDIAVFNPREGVDPERLSKYAEELVRSGVARAVWLKAGTHGSYRLPRLIHLAGERRTETMAREYGLRFLVDVARAYFNPRLSFEHRRVAEQVRDGESVLDMFTGVGGFAVHIAHLRKSRVVAVDINPYAAYLAARNAEINRLAGEVAVVRANARVLPEILEPVFDRVIMNHPTASLSFAREACNLARPGQVVAIHVYLLAGEPGEAEEAARGAFKPFCRILGSRVRRVIDHSPRKFIYSVDLEVERSDGYH